MEKWWVIASVLLSVVLCGAFALRYIFRLRSRINYLINAAMNNDFSYKFPVTGVSRYESRINGSLNMLVEHLDRLSAEARENETFLGKIINLVDTGIIIANSRGHVLFYNKASLTLLSVPVLTDLRQLPRDMSQLMMSRNEVKLKGDVYTVCTVNDISQTLQRAEIESLEKLTRVLTHEIMNSLTPVSSIAETLARWDEEEISKEKLRRQMGVILSSSRALMDFVQNFRKFTVLPEPKPHVFYVRPFIDGIVLMARQFKNAGDVRFSATVFPPDAMIYTDVNMLNLVLVNLLKNAVEAGCSEVVVECRIRKDESVEISVTNNGELIPERVASDIFTPFFTTKEKGSGIGLSLSRRIVARLGGTLTLSTSPCTRFTIVL